MLTIMRQQQGVDMYDLLSHTELLGNLVRLKVNRCSALGVHLCANLCLLVSRKR